MAPIIISEVAREAWGMILDQMADLQERMKGFGFQHAAANYSSADGSGLSEVGFLNGTGSVLSGAALSIGPVPASISIDIDDAQQPSLRVHGYGADDDSLQGAATKIMENIAAFIYATTDDVVIDLDMKIETDYGLTVEVNGPGGKNWEQPVRTKTAAELRAWLYREVERIEDQLSDRFNTLSQHWVNEIEARWPGSNPDFIAGNGDLFLHLDHPSAGRIRFDNWIYEDLEEIWPGLSEYVEAYEDLYSELQLGIGLPGTDRLRAEKELQAEEEAVLEM